MSSGGATIKDIADSLTKWDTPWKEATEVDIAAAVWWRMTNPPLSKTVEWFTQWYTYFVADSPEKKYHFATWCYLNMEKL